MQTLKFGASGPDVGKLHQALIEAGYTVPAEDLTTSKFLGGTALAVRQFQASQGLVGDAIVGPKTWEALSGLAKDARFKAPGWCYAPATVPDALRPVVDAAVGQIGTSEIGTSNVIPGDPYGHEQHGQPWCAYFVSWAYGKAPAGSPFGVIASAYKMMAWAKDHDKILPPGCAPRAGDIFVILRGDLHGHVGLIVNVADNGKLSTCEGNAGNAVRGLVRSRAQFTCVVRPAMACQ
jgi:hypothetical protein